MPNFPVYIPQPIDLLTPAMNIMQIKQGQERLGLLREQGELDKMRMGLWQSQEAREQEKYTRQKQVEDMPIYLDDLFSTTPPMEYQKTGITSLGNLGQNARQSIIDNANRMGIVETNPQTGRQFIPYWKYQLAQDMFKQNINMRKEVAQAIYADVNMEIENIENNIAQMGESNKVMKPEEMARITQTLSELKSKRNALENALVGYGVKQPTEKYTLENIKAEKVRAGEMTLEEAESMTEKEYAPVEDVELIGDTWMFGSRDRPKGKFTPWRKATKAEIETKVTGKPKEYAEPTSIKEWRNYNESLKKRGMSEISYDEFFDMKKGYKVSRNDIDDLEWDLDDLRAQLKDASEEEAPALMTQIAELEEQLENMKSAYYSQWRVSPKGQVKPPTQKPTPTPQSKGEKDWSHLWR